jgi:hypothetical protein
MAETMVEKATCEDCGADVRENTVFCYNCGRRFAEVASPSNGRPSEAMSDEAKTALDDLAAKLKIDEPENVDRLALAAAERKKSRIAPKKAKEDVWEEVEPSTRGVFIISLVIFVLVAAVVFITVYWK